MKQFIDLRNPLSRALWCGNFSCNEKELIDAVNYLHSADVGAVGWYLATRFSLNHDTDDDPRG